jgi:iron-sulfur cluster repair protein YtfE (RIC family)
MSASIPARVNPPQRGLPEEHQHLNEVFQALLNCAGTGDWQTCDEIWDGFCDDLRKHLDYEESALFPRFIEEGMRERRATQELLQDHEEIRRRLDALGIAIQLHTIRAEAIATFISAMRQHASREDELFHPWLLKNAESS